MNTDAKPSATPPPVTTLAEIKFSLPQLLEELKTERAASAFAMEKLDQTEIGKLFKAKIAPRRAKSKK